MNRLTHRAIEPRLAMAAALLCAASAASAEEPINPSWYMQPALVGMKADDQFGVDKRDWGAGFRFGKPLNHWWDMQLGATHVRAKDGAARHTQSTLGVDGLLMFSRMNFRPFLLVGVGAERDKVNNVLRNVSRTSPYVSAGLGFQVGLSEQWTLQSDLRVVHGRLRGDGDFGFGHSNNKYLTVGLNYAFNKPAPPPPRPEPSPPPPPPVQTPPPPPPPVAPPPPPPPRFEKVVLSATELFGFDSATLSMPQPKLDEIATALNADTSVNNIVITGYADRLGSTKYNQKLSERRAMAVRDYLAGKGIATSRMSARGLGEANPVAVCNNKKRADLIQCLEPNRRVEVEQITVERRVQ